MGKNITLKKGYDIKVIGAVSSNEVKDHKSTTYAMKPTDFLGIAPIPKLVPEIGSEVKAGDPLFFNKKTADLIYTAPVSGEVIELRRGEKRKVTEIVILADQEQKFKDFGTLNLQSSTEEQVKTRLMESGAWHFLRQRPFNVGANPADKPKGIFISGFNTAPLAPNMSVAMNGKEKYFQAGINVLAKLAPIHLSVEQGSSIPSFENLKNVTTHTFSGPHPAGNVGIQIHHISQILKGEIAWTIDPQDVAVIGQLALEGIYNPKRVITVSGNAVKKSSYYNVTVGVNVTGLVDTAIDNSRIIDGDILTGVKIKNDGFLGFYNDLISVIKEGNEYEFFGWLLPSYKRPTMSKTLVGSFLNNKAFDINTNMHGEHRAFVVSGEYEQVVPMDIYPVHLLKSIIVNDFDSMEGLGIYEVVEEDFALCEFVCTSKQEVQKTLRSGLDYIREQG